MVLAVAVMALIGIQAMDGFNPLMAQLILVAVVVVEFGAVQLKI